MSDLGVKINKNIGAIVVAAIIWLFVVMFVVAPIAYTTVTDTTINSSKFIEDCVKNISSATTFFKSFDGAHIGALLKGIVIFTIIYLPFIIIGLYKGRKKGEYDKIEHGSSDWSVAGEQYRILSRNNGLILAEKNYLPLDKLGNTNVLIVGGSGSGKSSAYTILPRLLLILSSPNNNQG